MASPSDLQATVQRRVLDFLAQQIILDRLASSAHMELRRLVQSLETLHQILQAPYSSAGKRYLRCSVAYAGPPLLNVDSSDGVDVDILYYGPTAGGTRNSLKEGEEEPESA